MQFPILTTAALVTLASILDAQPNESRVRDAISRAIPLVEESAMTYVAKRDCFTCHHQALPMMALAKAQAHELTVQKDAIPTQTSFTLEYFEDRLDRLPKGHGVPGGPYTAGYALAALAAAKSPPDIRTQALANYLLKTQHKDGSWRIRTHRPPLEDSHFTATALAIHGLETYHQCESEAPLDKARQWLRNAQPKSTEDHAFALLAHHWAGLDTQAPATALLQFRHDDHGWSQLPGMDSDAYATGQALAALRATDNLPQNSLTHAKSVQWLLDNQRPDGSWQVRTRSKPIQKYFESGFPHGKDQFISISATCWAILALLPQPSLP